ncbi:MAG: hypothetical protein IKZ08_02625 [Bacteroidales bacterium]|nr:hypothetical protein [Bacteroidales bacterium]
MNSTMIKVLGILGTALSVGSTILNAINQKNEINEAARKAVEETLKKN